VSAPHKGGVSSVSPPSACLSSVSPPSPYPYHLSCVCQSRLSYVSRVSRVSRVSCVRRVRDAQYTKRCSLWRWFVVSQRQATQDADTHHTRCKHKPIHIACYVCMLCVYVMCVCHVTCLASRHSLACRRVGHASMKCNIVMCVCGVTCLASSRVGHVRMRCVRCDLPAMCFGHVT